MKAARKADAVSRRDTQKWEANMVSLEGKGSKHAAN